MTLRELQALVTLFHGCQDQTIRDKAVRLVPELAEWKNVKFYEERPPANETKG